MGRCATTVEGPRPDRADGSGRCLPGRVGGADGADAVPRSAGPRDQPRRAGGSRLGPREARSAAGATPSGRRPQLGDSVAAPAVSITAEPLGRHRDRTRSCATAWCGSARRRRRGGGAPGPRGPRSDVSAADRCCAAITQARRTARGAGHPGRSSGSRCAADPYTANASVGECTAKAGCPLRPSRDGRRYDIAGAGGTAVLASRSTDALTGSASSRWTIHQRRDNRRGPHKRTHDPRPDRPAICAAPHGAAPPRSRCANGRTAPGPTAGTRRCPPHPSSGRVAVGHRAGCTVARGPADRSGSAPDDADDRGARAHADRSSAARRRPAPIVSPARPGRQLPRDRAGSGAQAGADPLSGAAPRHCHSSTGRAGRPSDHRALSPRDRRATASEGSRRRASTSARPGAKRCRHLGPNGRVDWAGRPTASSCTVRRGGPRQPAVHNTGATQARSAPGDLRAPRRGATGDHGAAGGRRRCQHRHGLSPGTPVPRDGPRLSA